MERVYTTPRLDKLGIRPGMRVALVDVEDDAFEAQLRDRTHDLTRGEPLPDTDLVLFAADTLDALDRLPASATHPPQRRDLGRVAQGQGRDDPRRRRDRRREGGCARRQQGGAFSTRRGPRSAS